MVSGYSLQNNREVNSLHLGKALIQSFGAKEPLSAVRLYIEMNKSDGVYPFKLMTSFPKRIFGEEDYDKPLDSLGKALFNLTVFCILYSHFLYRSGSFCYSYCFQIIR